MTDPNQPTDLASEGITPEESNAAAERALRRATRGGPTRSTKKSSRSGRDPELIGSAIDKLVVEQGWQRDNAIATLTNSWAEIVGPDVASHCVPREFNEGTLKIEAESTAWATQLKLLQSTILAKIATAIGDGIVRKIVIFGPQAPSWNKGAWTVQGRGPRDTYG
jgi:predicted nucleic acid-binding Zn ribbon protein